jgi:uncharacterized membrane protein
MTTLSLGLHVLFAAILVGGQVLLYFAVVPSTWLIDDERLRSAVTRVVARRFGMLVGLSLVGLLVTGLFQFYRDELVPPVVQEEMLDYRWGWVFMVKMTLFVVLVAMIAVHGMVFGRRIRVASDAVAAGEQDAIGQLERLRRNSLLFSALMVLVSVALVLLGATLSNDAYSLQRS